MDRFRPARAGSAWCWMSGQRGIRPPRPHPQHLWQQNTLRRRPGRRDDAGCVPPSRRQTADGNIAQIANVLQSMVLTEDERMVLTPTYHVFDLYRPHAGATSVRTEIEPAALSWAPAARTRQSGAERLGLEQAETRLRSA